MERRSLPRRVLVAPLVFMNNLMETERLWVSDFDDGFINGVQTAAAAAPVNSGEWVSYIDDESGAEYWFNETTQETTYEDPHWQAQEQEW